MSIGLYGIHYSNRKEDEHWGKNCFNSSFPTALACYMLDNDIPAVYNKLTFKNGKPVVEASEIHLKNVFNSINTPVNKLDFHFESVFSPYQQYSFDLIDGIDLVVKNTTGDSLMPLEVKLTVLPTANTSHLPENQWGCELVIRAATTSYCALGMFDVNMQMPSKKKFGHQFYLNQITTNG